MKRILLIIGVLACLMAAHLGFSQVAEGVIVYEVRVNMHRTLPPEREEMKSMIPEFRVSREQLFFNENESLYKPIEEEEEDTEEGGMRIVVRTPQNEVYVNQQAGKRILLNDFMGKKFLIEDSLKMSPWKLSDETKEIAGYTCQKATFSNEERKQTVVAWYSNQLRPFVGPENFNTLPGAVLQVDINEGERILTAIKIEARKISKGELKMPTGGTKTTEAEFRKMVSQQMERMRAGGGNIMIRN